MASPPPTTTTTIKEEDNNNNTQQQDDDHNDDVIIRIDGSMGEGGGQLLRNAISFATLLNKPMIVNNIRAGRSKPGLKAQHLASLQLPVEIVCCGCRDEQQEQQKEQQQQQQQGEQEAKSSKKQNLLNNDNNDNNDDDDHNNHRQQQEQRRQRQQQQQPHSKRQKDNGNGGNSNSIIQNEQSTNKTNTNTNNHRSSCAPPLLTGDLLHSQEIHFQPPPPPPTLLEKSSNSNNHDEDQHEEQQQQHEQEEWTITKDIGTAGSICLLLQAALPCAIFKCLTSSSTRRRRTLHLHLHGGTNATLAPQYDYWERVFLPTLQEQCGFVFNNNTSSSLLLPSIRARVIRRGYFPRGGGHVCITIQSPPPPPSAATATDTTTTTTTTTASSGRSNNVAATSSTAYCLNPIQLTERGNVKHIYIRSFHAGRLPRHLAETMAKAAEKLLRQTFPSSSLSSSLSSHHGRGRGHPQQQQQQQPQQGPTVDIELDIVTEPDAVGSGLGILVVATTTTGCRLAGSALSDPKKKAADVGRAAAQELLDTLKDGGCVDEWLQDQLILYMALAKGVSEIKTGSLTLHTRTAIDIAQVFCGAKCFEIHKLGGGSDDDDDVDTKATNERLLCKNGQNQIGGYSDNESYGLNGRIPGQHLIRCHGIGHTVSPLD